MRTQWHSDFDPKTILVLDAAMSRATTFLEEDESFAAVDVRDLKTILTTALAKLAENGESDPVRLANAAIGEVRQHEQVKRSIAHVNAAQKTA